MLQDKYGRLIIVGVFIIIGIVLMIAPGMSSKKRALEAEQLNFTGAPQEAAKIDLPEQVNQNVAVQAPQSPELSGEDAMLDAWGMRPKVKFQEPVNLNEDASSQEQTEMSSNEQQPVKEESDNIKEQISSEHTISKETSVSEEQKTKEPLYSGNVIKVNGKCFSKPKIVPGISYEECLAAGRSFGIKSCNKSDSRKDGWAGAVKACGGIEKMPNMDDLLAIARILYNNKTIYVKEVERSNYRGYGSYTEENVNSCGTFTFKHNDIRYIPEVAERLGFPSVGSFQIWGNTEINPIYALSLIYEAKSVSYHDCTKKKGGNYYTVCEIPCSE